MKTLSKNSLIRVVLALGIILLNVPQQAQAAIFSREASAAVLAKDAEASEFAVMPSAQPNPSSLMGFGGVTSIGHELVAKMRTLLEPQPAAKPQTVILEEVAPTPAPPAAEGIVVEPVAPAAVVVTPVAVSAPAITVEEMAPATEAAAAQEREDEEKALFPLLWKGNAGAAGAAVLGGGTESVVTTRAIAIGLVIALIAAGIAIPLALSSGGGGSSSQDGGSGNDDPNSPTDPNNPPPTNPEIPEKPVVPESQPVPEPATMLLFGLGLLGLFSRKKVK